MSNKQPTIDEVMSLLKRHNELTGKRFTKIVLFDDLSGNFAKFGKNSKEIKNSGFHDLRMAAKWLKKRIKKANKCNESSRPTLVKTLYEHYRVPYCSWDRGWHNLDANDIRKADNATHKPLDKWLFRYEQHDKRFYPRLRGGMTTCTLVLSNNKPIVGTAYCSMSDNFCYRTGRQIALERALKQYREEYGE